MSKIDYSISLEKQHTWTIYQEAPSSALLEKYQIVADNSWYEEYSYTGSRAEVEAQKAIELASASSNFSKDMSLNWSGLQVQTSMTRLQGELWELKVRKNLLKTRNGEDDTHADADAMAAEFGDEENPKTLSVAISAIQESILNHEIFEDYTAEQLGALKMYMNGATGGEKITNKEGKSITLKTIISPDSNDVKFVIKNPTYYVPSISITYSYWSFSRDDSTKEIGKPTTDIPGGFNPPAGYTALFMGRASTKEGSGYKVEETYLIGKFNKEPYVRNNSN